MGFRSSNLNFPLLSFFWLFWVHSSRFLINFLLRHSFLLQKDEVYLNLVLEYIPETVYKVARQYAKNKQTIPINFIRVSTDDMSASPEPPITRASSHFSSTCTNCSAVLLTSTRWAFVIATLNRKTCCWIPSRLCWNCVTLAAPSNCFRASRTCHISARATTERPNLFLVQLTTRQRLVSALGTLIEAGWEFVGLKTSKVRLHNAIWKIRLVCCIPQETFGLSRFHCIFYSTSLFRTSKNIFQELRSAAYSKSSSAPLHRKNKFFVKFFPFASLF